MKKTSLLLVLSFVFFFSLRAVDSLVPAETVESPYVLIKEAPPIGEQDEKPIPSPGFGYAWVRGHWKWKDKYVWEPGHWKKKPHPLAVWVQGRWKQKLDNGWLWVEGRWE